MMRIDLISVMISKVYERLTLTKSIAFKSVVLDVGVLVSET